MTKPKRDQPTPPIADPPRRDDDDARPTHPIADPPGRPGAHPEHPIHEPPTAEPKA
jgi:hypothetical protein